jgi:hypothetical protein
MSNPNLTPEVQSALNAINAATAQLAVALGASTAPVVPTSPWFLPTDAEKVAFTQANAVSAVDLEGYPGQSKDGTWPTNTAQKAIAPLSGTDKLDEGKLLAYAKFGYRADGVRMSWASSALAGARALCSRIEAAASPQEADNVIGRAGSVAPKVAQYLILNNATQGGLFAPFMLILGSLDSNSVVTDAAAFITNTTQPGGPGPSGQ